MPRPTLLITANHTLKPLWEHLAQHYDLCVFGPPQVANQVIEMGHEGAGVLSRYVSPDTQEEATNRAYEFATVIYAQDEEWWKQRFPNPDNVPSLSLDRIGKWWPAMVGEHVKQSVGIIEALKKLTADKKVSGCLVHEDVTPDMRTLAMFCKGRGIPTIHVPHANCYYTGKEWDIHTESITDCIAASGTYSRDFYTRWGYKGRIELVGLPQYDAWYSDKVPSREEARTVLGIGKDDFVIVYATTWGQLTSSRGLGSLDKDHAEAMDAVLSTAKEMKATLVIKAHPTEAQGQENSYVEMLKVAGVNGCVVRHYNEYVIRAGDILIANGPSNICLSGAVVGKPTLYFPTEGFDFPFGPIRIGDNLTADIKLAQEKDRDYWDIFCKVMNEPHGDFENGSACERITKLTKEVCHD